ncbi:MAG TPA: hypothetical protein VIK53_03825 [Verrucomicrobiae bacterium]
MNNQTSVIISVVALSISASAFLFSILSFAWQHWRKVDAVVCTLVANECNHHRGIFQFSFANLGTRPTLLRDVSVEVFMKPELHGELSNDCTVVAGILPQVIKAGEMYSISIETKWTDTFLVKAAKEAADRGKKNAMLFFVAKTICWNPKGERMMGQKHFSTFTYNPQERSSGYECPSFDRSFRLTKHRGARLTPRIVPS